MHVLGIPPSPAIGVIKNAIREAILDGKIPNEHDAAYAYMIEIKDELLAGLDEDDFRDRR
jgi:poly(A) polymerase